MAYYNCRSFSGLIIKRFTPLKSHCKVFCNGKIVVNGATSERGARALADKYCQIIQGAGYPAVSVKDFKIVNIIATFNFGHIIRLSEVYNHLHSPEAKSFTKSISFEPEFFPALFVKLENVTCALFHSGKCNILGAKSELDVQAAELDFRIITDQ